MRLFLLSATLLALVGCAAPQLPGIRDRAPGDTHGIAQAEAVKQVSNTAKHLDDGKSIVYSQNFGGGGVGVGLLLGPLGVAANVAMIDAVTKADVAKLFGRVKLDPIALFTEASNGTPLTLQTPGTAAVVRFTPYLLVVKVSESVLAPAAALFVEAPAAAPGKTYTTKYVYQLSPQFSLDALAGISDVQLATLTDEAREAYRQLIAFYLRDSNQAVSREPKIVFKSAFMNPRFDYEMPGSLIEQAGPQVWVRSFGGVFAVPKAGISYTVQR
ncbi:hypothetical protein [Roseateles paludis]|uniref:Lipoprotein n=1 Tax=Roseateles paludis TaxID=3145238 RepID=A0ABV0G1C5_9BURK